MRINRPTRVFGRSLASEKSAKSSLTSGFGALSKIQKEFLERQKKFDLPHLALVGDKSPLFQFNSRNYLMAQDLELESPNSGYSMFQKIQATRKKRKIDAQKSPYSDINEVRKRLRMIKDGKMI